MKEELYHIALDDYEHGVVIRSLNDKKTDLKKEGDVYKRQPLKMTPLSSATVTESRKSYR